MVLPIWLLEKGCTKDIIKGSCVPRIKVADSGQFIIFYVLVDSYSGWNLCLSGGVKTEY